MISSRHGGLGGGASGWKSMVCLLWSLFLLYLCLIQALHVVGLVVSFLSFRPWSCSSRTNAYARVASNFSGLGKFPILVLPF